MTTDCIPASLSGLGPPQARLHDSTATAAPAEHPDSTTGTIAAPAEHPDSTTGTIAAPAEHPDSTGTSRGA